jgi:outer membrane protein assembly factor BamB
MNIKYRFQIKSAMVVFILCTLSIVMAQSQDWGQKAKQILDTTGIKGGLIVHLGCGDGKLTSALRINDSYIVQGLDTDIDKIQRVRKTIISKGLYGKVTIREFDGKNLPYINNLVNLVVATDKFEVSKDEMLRILAPRGAAYVNGKKIVKPWPAELDEWTHFHHDPQGTMVGKDQVVGPPRRIQWIGEPKWLRNHDFMSSMHAMVSARGRIFYVIDEGLRNHIFLPSRWTLIARDGFNGTILWKKPLADWHPNNWPLKSGPGHHPRKLVAVGDSIYIAAGLTDPVRAIDAATGDLIRTYDRTKPTQEIIFSDGVLYLLVDPHITPVNYRAKTASYKEINHANIGWAWTLESPERIIMAIKADSGKVLWEHPAKVAPLTLTVCDDRILFHNGQGMVALDRKTGKELWASEGPAVSRVVTGGSLRVSFSEGIVVFASGTAMDWNIAENKPSLSGRPLHYRRLNLVAEHGQTTTQWNALQGIGSAYRRNRERFCCQKPAGFPDASKMLSQPGDDEVHHDEWNRNGILQSGRRGGVYPQLCTWKLHIWRYAVQWTAIQASRFLRLLLPVKTGVSLCTGTGAVQC